MLKKKVYFKVTDIGMRVLRTIFPEYFADDSLPPSDRYVEYAFVVKNLPPLPAKVLDVGCSGSLFPLLLASFGYDTYGIDIRNYPILKRLDFDNFKFIKDDIRNSSLPDAYFDTISQSLQLNILVFKEDMVWMMI